MKSLIYLIAGIAIGVLIAPEKGADTRKRFADQFGNLKEEGADFIDDVKQNAKSKLQSAQDEMHYTADEAM